MSITKISLLAGGAFVLMGVAGAGGFYVGSLSQKLAYLERVQYAAPPALAGVPTYPAAPSVAAPAAFAPPASTLTGEGVPVQIAGLLNNAETVKALVGVLAKATAFSVDGEVSNDQPIFAFFDPRCPYCKRAMVELNGKAKINWIPVSLLGDMQSGSDMIDGMRTLEGQAAISAVAGGAIPKATGSAETQGQLDNNASVLFALYEGSHDSVAVPTFFVPRKDGTAAFFRGFDAGDGAKIVEAYGS
jgi:hypothetical protein